MGSYETLGWAILTGVGLMAFVRALYPRHEKDRLPAPGYDLASRVIGKLVGGAGLGLSGFALSKLEGWVWIANILP